MPMPSNIVTSTPKLDLSGYGMSMVPAPTYATTPVKTNVLPNSRPATSSDPSYGKNQSLVTGNIGKATPPTSSSIGQSTPSKGLVSLPSSPSSSSGTPGVYGTPYQPPVQASQNQPYQQPLNQITTGAQYDAAVNGAPTTPINYSGDTAQQTSYQPVQSPPFSGAPQSSTFPGLVSSLYGAGSSNFTTGQQAANIAADYGKRIADVGQQGAIGEGSRLTTGTTPVAQGGAAVIAQTTAAQQSALAKGEEAALQGTGQQLTANSQAANAYGAAAGLSAPQPYGLTTQPYNPLSDTYGGGGTGGAINRATQASNIGSAQDFQTKINAIQASAPAADAAFSVLSSYAQKIGDANIPIIQGLQKLYGSTAQGSQAVAGFQAQLQAVRQAWTAIEGSDGTAAIPDNVTAQQINQIQQQLKIDSQNKIAGYQNQLGNLGGSSGGNTGGNMFGSFF